MSDPYDEREARVFWTYKIIEALLYAIGVVSLCISAWALLGQI